MTEKKRKWLIACNRALASGLALLGFAGCTDEETPAEYGQPYCKFELKGKVKDRQEQVIDRARIILRTGNGNEHYGYFYGYADTLEVEKDGTYYFRDDGAFPGNNYRVICYDPTGTYKADSTDIKSEPTGGNNHWYAGTDSKEVDFILEEHTDE
ncbi:MAG: radical SAM-associated putative lipoprotein [Prevotellaceae bacterium]|jgi:putative lipoprotein (rSAM/lipoprotein system)|nr:radical SAM-associated putative lipoprotein [Prevotellaceae bacterium]